jgi:hypothetical protein
VFLPEENKVNNGLIYHTDVRWLSSGSVVQRFFHLLREIKFFITTENKSIEELCVSELALLVNVTGDLNSLKGRW